MRTVKTNIAFPLISKFGVLILPFSLSLKLITQGSRRASGSVKAQGSQMVGYAEPLGQMGQ